MATKGYAIDFDDMEFVKPNETVVGLLEDNGAELAIEWLAFEVKAADPSVPELDMVAATATLSGSTLKEAQCFPIADAGGPTPFSTNPDFTMPKIDIPYEIASLDLKVDITDFEISGTFAADGSAINDVKTTGILDTADLSKAAGVNVCSIASLAGNPCITCPSGTETCLELELIGETAPLDSRVSIDRSYDYKTDPACR